ncbi:MAG: CRISPR-associated protein Cas4 [Ruthenibacterium sp.]
MTEYQEDDFLQLSGVQHFLFCRRQWALIHVESLWAENERTVSGAQMHEKTHDASQTEKRGDVIITRGMNICSRTLGVSGQCDVLEFHRDANGISLQNWIELWRPFPVEYKRGEPKAGNYDAAQLCAQAMCLEEMLCCDIPCGALFYGEIKRREAVEFTPELRDAVQNALREMHDLFRRGYTPKSKPSKACNACSLKELCLPTLAKTQSVQNYLVQSLEGETCGTC